jgi:two-component system osmolarity sensor histidine kinase EnvZ
MRSSIADEIVMVTYFSKQHFDQNLLDGLNKLDLNIRIIDNKQFEGSRWDKIEDIELNNFGLLLQKKLQEPFYMTYINNKDRILATIQVDKLKFLQIDFSKKRIKNSTTYVFLLWSLTAGIIFVIVSLIFMRNQVRSITKLSYAAQEFGKGKEYSLVPSGAKEIKSLGHSLLQMKKDLAKNIKDRTELLAHIAHDLRTPITRIKLELALMSKSKAVASINNNIAKIENMLSSYLNFAKQEGNEKLVKVDIVHKLQKILKSYTDKRLKATLPKKKIHLMLKASAFERAITNIIDNSIKFAKNKMSVSLRDDKNFIIIEVDDDGAGIDEAYHNSVFEPFFKQDDESKEGYGLGLAICKSIISAHGGHIILDKSQYGGLNFKVKLPK